MSRRVANGNRVQELHVYVLREGEGHFERIEEQPDIVPLASTVREVLDRALLLLENGKGRDGLEMIGNGIVAGRQIANEPCLFPDPTRGIRSIGEAIRHFLQTMQNNFPDIYLTDTDGEAYTARKGLDKPFQSLGDFNPVAAGDLRIQYQITPATSYLLTYVKLSTSIT